MPTEFWLHVGSEPDYCPHCGREYDSFAADHGEAGTREVVVSEEPMETTTADLYRCTTTDEDR